MAVDQLRARLEEDLTRVRQLPESQIAQVLRMQAETSRARADALLHRVMELRVVVDERRRGLVRLRMRQLRGGRRPH